MAKACGLDDFKVADTLGKDGEVTGFDYVKALAKFTGVRVPSGLSDLENKPVLHNTVCEKDEMEDVVREALK